MRTNLSDGLLECVNKNLTNMPLLNIDTVKVFEFGNVWNSDTEYNALAISMCDGKKKSNYGENVDMILGEIKRELGLSALEFEKKNTKPYIVEINFDKIIESLQDNNSADFENQENKKLETKNVFINTEHINKKSGSEKYKSYSQYPFIVRDVSFWIDVNSELLEVEVEKDIENKKLKTSKKENSKIENIIKQNAGDLCISINIFDEFQKDFDGVMKKSLGYRLVYQSFEKTLTDEEVNMQSDNVYNKLKELGLEVR
jgi:phenylalanyl-tRNA synthetase beta subunit